MEIEFKELDVRPILADGGEPFQAIMAAVEGLAPGQGLKLLAPFKPLPLFTVMERRGFLHQVAELEGGDFEVRFLPRATEVLASEDVGTRTNGPRPFETSTSPISIPRSRWSAFFQNWKRWLPERSCSRYSPASRCSCFRN